MEHSFRTNLGLALLRVGMGAMFIGHGLPKLAGGMDTWVKIGGAMANFGITFAPAFWGFLAAAAECGGGLFLMLGLFTPLAALSLAFTMFVASTMHLAKGDAFFGGASHAIEALIVFVSILIAGPGSFSLDERLFRRQ